MKKLLNKQRKRPQKRKKAKNKSVCMILEKRVIKPTRPYKNPHEDSLVLGMALMGTSEIVKSI